VTLLTVGHGATDRAKLGALLTGAGVRLVVDVRRFPGSRNSPDVAQDELLRWLPECGVDYRWEQRLGGRRALAQDGPALDPWWQVPAFRAYAAHTRTAEFSDALHQVLREAAARRVAVMCSESVWWRCHRRLIADVAVIVEGVEGVEVEHLMPDGRLSPHRPAAGARVHADGQLYWDGSDGP